MEAVELRARVMGSELRIVATGCTLAVCREVQCFLGDLESSWSRFIETSDISRINLGSGQPVHVAPSTITLVATMIEAHQRTAGRYDPCVLPALVAHGDRASRDGSCASTSLPGDARLMPGAILDTVVDSQRSQVTTVVGVALDPGGIGKGLAADLAVDWMLRHGAAGALVSIGGDLAMAGTSPDERGWIIAVEDPRMADETLCTLAVNGGGVATSSTLSRRWEHDGSARHHVIDPSTGDPSLTDLASVTVIADTGWAAEAHATAALLCGSSCAVDYLSGHGLSGIAMTTGGERLSTADLWQTSHDGHRVTS